MKLIKGFFWPKNKCIAVQLVGDKCPSDKNELIAGKKGSVLLDPFETRKWNNK